MHLFSLSDAVFLKLKHGTCLVERRQLLAIGDVGNGVMKARVQAADNVVDELLIRYW